MTLSLEEQKEAFLAEQELSHYGVPGMRWGRRKAGGAESDGPSGPTRRDLKALDKQTKAKQNAKRDKQIDKARADYAANARSKYLAAKAQYNQDKHVIGKRAAKEAFDKVKLKNIQDAEVANMAKSGRETTNALIATGAFVVGAIALNALARNL